MKTTLSRGLLAAIGFATLAGRPADAGTVEQTLTIPTNARYVSFDPFNPAFGHLDFVAIVVNATFQPISQGGFYNDQDVPLTLTGFGNLYLNYGLFNHDSGEFSAHGTFNFGSQVVNPGDGVTLTTPAINVASTDILTADQWTAIGGTSGFQPQLSLVFDAYRYIISSGVPNYGPGEVYQADGGDYSGTAKVYYFFNMPETSLSDVPLLIPEPSTIVSAGIAAVTGLGLTCRRRRQKSAD